jgi:hypothetical protein
MGPCCRNYMGIARKPTMINQKSHFGITITISPQSFPWSQGPMSSTPSLSAVDPKQGPSLLETMTAEGSYEQEALPHAPMCPKQDPLNHDPPCQTAHVELGPRDHDLCRLTQEQKDDQGLPVDAQSCGDDAKELGLSTPGHLGTQDLETFARLAPVFTHMHLAGSSEPIPLQTLPALEPRSKHVTENPITINKEQSSKVNWDLDMDNKKDADKETIDYVTDGSVSGVYHPSHTASAIGMLPCLPEVTIIIWQVLVLRWRIR